MYPMYPRWTQWAQQAGKARPTYWKYLEARNNADIFNDEVTFKDHFKVNVVMCRGVTENDGSGQKFITKTCPSSRIRILK